MKMQQTMEGIRGSVNMSIKAVKNIPCKMNNKKPTQAQMVRDDIKEAFDSRISKFEFEGDYNYTTLGSLARTELARYFRCNIYRPTERKVELALAEKGYMGITVACRDCMNGEQAITVHSVTCSDRKHVYVEIDFDYIDKFEETLMLKTMQDPKNRRV